MLMSLPIGATRMADEDAMRRPGRAEA